MWPGIALLIQATNCRGSFDFSCTTRWYFQTTLSRGHIPDDDKATPKMVISGAGVRRPAEPSPSQFGYHAKFGSSTSNSVSIHRGYKNWYLSTGDSRWNVLRWVIISNLVSIIQTLCGDKISRLVFPPCGGGGDQNLVSLCQADSLSPKNFDSNLCCLSIHNFWSFLVHRHTQTVAFM